jgi:hypothetical protein
MIFTFHQIQSVAESANTFSILKIHNYALTILTSWTGMPSIDKTPIISVDLTNWWEH